MTQPKERLPSFLAEPFRIGQEISVTGKWIPKKKRAGCSENLPSRKRC
jgi:hypothetical protein